MKLGTHLASQSTIIFGARIFGAGLIFLAQAALARIWGGEVLGEYLLIVATVNLVAVFMPLGFHTVGTFFAAEYRARGQGQLLWRFVLRAYGQMLAMAALVALTGAGLSRFLPADLGFAAALWLPISLMALATATIFVNSAILVGLKRPYAGFFADGLFRPMLIVAVLAIVFAASGGTENLSSVIWALSLVYALISAVHFGVVVRAVKGVPVNQDDRARESRRWWRYAAPWVLIALATDFFFDLDLIVLAGLVDTQTLAIFGVCARIFALAAFGVTAVYAVSLPDMFESEARSERADFHRKVGDANLVAAGLALAMFLGVAVLGRYVLMLFGPEFEAGAGPLTILFLVLLVRAVFGPASLVLSIHDRPWASLPAVIGGLGVLVVANFVLVPPFGLTGAALAALLAISVWSVTLWVVARRTAGVDVSIFPRLWGLVTRAGGINARSVPEARSSTGSNG